MSDRNWDAEMAKIDRQLASISDDKLLANRNAPVMPPASASGAPAAEGRATPGKMGWGVAIRVSLAVALAIAVNFWPYEARCGLGLSGYLGATAAIIAAGAWAAVSTWKSRSPRAHLLVLAVVVWGASLAAREVLPRTGYAKEVREWACK